MSVPPKLPENFHLALIMDGNGRWSKKNGHTSRLKGHEAGMERVDELFRAASEFGVKYLSLFAFSTENWQRSDKEVRGLMKLFRRFLDKKGEELLRENVRVRFIGDISAFEDDIVARMRSLEERSAKNTGLQALVAMNYGGQDEILRTARRVLETGQEMTRENFEAHLDTADAPMVDFLIRTSGEERISNFMLWQCAYSEFYFTNTLWPDFDSEALREALLEFGRRDRRFGKE